MTENFPKLMSDIKPQIQKVQGTQEGQTQTNKQTPQLYSGILFSNTESQT